MLGEGLPEGVRIEVLERDAGGIRGGLVALTVGPIGLRECFGIALAQRGDGDWLLGHGPIANEMSRATPGDFLRHALSMAPLTGTAMSRIGLLGNCGDLVGDVLHTLSGEPAFDDMVVDPTNPGEGPVGTGDVDPTGADQYGYATRWPFGCLMRNPCEETTPRSPGLTEEQRARVRERLLAWQAAMAAMLSPCGPTPLREPTWTQAGRRLLAVPEHGLFRIQAVSLYPAFAPFILGLFRVRPDECVTSLIDAGRPFERRLASLLTSEILHGGRSIDLARLRRFRTVPGELWGGDVLALVRFAVQVPLDDLPRDAAGWLRLASLLRATDRFVNVTGLSPIGLVGAKDAWSLSTMQLEEELTDAIDVVNALVDGLVGPALRRLGLRAGQRKFRWIAGRMLFEGLGPNAVVDLSHRWHGTGRMEGFDGRAAILAAGGLSWVGLFPDYDHGDGIRISCLTTSAALAAEGTSGLDGDGVGGLEHCVGTYDSRCARGEVHVASVHRVGADGRRTRLSTLSLTAIPVEGRIHTRVEQHRGLRNAPPRPEAKAAVAALVGWLDGMPFPDRIGAVEPERGVSADALIAADRAWQPYLRRHHRRHDLPATLALVRRLDDSAAAHGHP